MSTEHSADEEGSGIRSPASSTPSHSFPRRRFLTDCGFGLGAMALADLLGQEGLLANPAKPSFEPAFNDLRARAPHAEPRATAMISLFMHGGPAHMDLTDPKPELQKLDGMEYGGEIAYSFVNRASKRLLGSPWKFGPCGQSGTQISELLPHLQRIADDICLVRSMHTGHNGHEVSIRYFHGGIPAALGRPTLGSWLTYALGSETRDLPSYLVLVDPEGHPVDGVTNWSSGFIPPLFQGSALRAKEPRIPNLVPPPWLAGPLQTRNLAYLDRLNRRHGQRHPGEPDLDARIASYELAARMQLSATDALDISQETEATHRLYGLDDPVTREYGTRCLIARRLVERGVRFVQLFLGGQPWDNHTNIREGLPAICRRTDKPAAALVTDLKSRGLLDTTLVHWGGEIGRLPVTEGEGSGCGRDHNGQGFSIWMAGGGVKPGIAFGETDEVGHRAVTDIVTPNDWQATVLHLFGLDHERLVYRHDSVEQRLTAGRPARIVDGILT